MFLFFYQVGLFSCSSVEPWACSKAFTIDSNSCSLNSNPSKGDWAVAFLTRPIIDSLGCYSISVKSSLQNNKGLVIVGFGKAVSLDNPSEIVWQKSIYQHLTGEKSEAKFGTVLSGMGRGIDKDTLTLVYNPSNGTLHGAYNLEPMILLRSDIPVSPGAPLQPFIAHGIRLPAQADSTTTIVSNPRSTQTP